MERSRTRSLPFPTLAVEGLLSLDGGANPIYVLARDVLLTESGFAPFLVDRLARPTPFYTGLPLLSPFSEGGGYPITNS